MSKENIVFAEGETDVTLPVTTVTKTNVVVLQGETPIVLDRKKEEDSFKGVAVGDSVKVLKQDGQYTMQVIPVAKAPKGNANGRPAGDAKRAHVIGKFMTTIVRKNNFIYTDSKTKVSEQAEIFRYDLGPKFFVLPEKSIAIAISGVITSEIILGFILNLGRQLIDDFHIHEDRDRLTDLIKKITDESGIAEKEVSGLGPVNFFLKDFTLRINRNVGAYSTPEEAKKTKEKIWTPSIEIDPNKLWDENNQLYRLPARGLDFDPFRFKIDVVKAADEVKFTNMPQARGAFVAVGNRFFISVAKGAYQDPENDLTAKYVTRDYRFNFISGANDDMVVQSIPFMKDGLEGFFAFLESFTNRYDVWRMSLDDFHAHFDKEDPSVNPNLWEKIYSDYKVTDVKHYELDELPIFNLENYNSKVPFDQRYVKMKKLTQLSYGDFPSLHRELGDFIKNAKPKVRQQDIFSRIEDKQAEAQFVKKVGQKVFFFIEKRLYRIDYSNSNIRYISCPSSMDWNLFGYMIIAAISKTIGECPLDINADDFSHRHNARAKLIAEISAAITEERLIRSFKLFDYHDLNFVHFTFMNVDSEPGYIDLEFEGTSTYTIRIQKHNELIFTVDSIKQVIY
ncbi:hypothetical protein WH47_09791 [Habropoda laboriosa]|uniref:Uncharacterized protein n=1 Tax=Habropoda laboriosa TaxID=597456 RepID=A0A0L7QIT1_9HYME|nr:hypothetical protein WH47_09791 [Habropoda laboriosa]